MYAHLYIGEHVCVCMCACFVVGISVVLPYLAVACLCKCFLCKSSVPQGKRPNNLSLLLGISLLILFSNLFELKT